MREITESAVKSAAYGIGSKIRMLTGDNIGAVRVPPEDGLGLSLLACVCFCAGIVSTVFGALPPKPMLKALLRRPHSQRVAELPYFR